MSEHPVIAIFDFDGTLVEGDSFWPFLGLIAGWPKTAITFTRGLALCAIYRLHKTKPGKSDSRTFIKDYLLRKLIAGKKLKDLPPILEKLRTWRKWKAPIHQALLDHHAKGHHIVIASGGLDLYLPALLRDLPHHALICTEIGIADGVSTGEMVIGNCVRERKAELVADYIKNYQAAHGPLADSWGYGNAPHDVPMLALVRHATLV
jgi:HAD superfamily phosphoserine phosphatase-like hydrolase